MQNSGPRSRAQGSSKVFLFERIEPRHSEVLEFRQMAAGETEDGCTFSLHESQLQPGKEPHPPHQHNGEEMFIIVDGALDVTIKGNTQRIRKGDCAFVGSGDQHGIRNPGPEIARYFVIELGPQR